VRVGSDFFCFVLREITNAFGAWHIQMAMAAVKAKDEQWFA
jgi:hypothetical protein